MHGFRFSTRPGPLATLSETFPFRTNTVSSFADRIIRWQRQHGRHDLPWQWTNDPYRIWLSEIMLQQTQVATVIPYYERFVERFPDVRALASAPIESVMACWAGLGYYSRARNLHRCAQQIADTHRGEFPREVQQLAQLPGVGRSTAAAIAALAFGERAAILDGNVRRVLARHCSIEGFPGRPQIERQFWQRAESLLPASEIEAYTQGLMDLGATVCTRSRPNCAACPVNETCVARSDRTIDKLPTPRPVRERPVRAQTVLAMQDATGAVLLELRPPSGIWGGLLSLPEFESEASDDAVVAEVQRSFRPNHRDYRGAWSNTARVHALHISDAAAPRTGNRDYGRRELITACSFKRQSANGAATRAGSPITAACIEPRIGVVLLQNRVLLQIRVNDFKASRGVSELHQLLLCFQRDRQHFTKTVRHPGGRIHLKRLLKR